LINLCTNAADYMTGNHQVLKVKIEKTDIKNKIIKIEQNGWPNFMKLTISDNGAGIDPKLIDKIFNPYFTTKEIGKGSGLGLSIVHNIIKNHDGHIYVESELEKGTTFTIYLPLEGDNTQITKRA
jgi:signal transduction histidine kinase